MDTWVQLPATLLPARVITFPLSVHSAAGQPTTSPSSIRSTATLCLGSPVPSSQGLSGCDLLFHKPRSALRASGASWKLSQGPQE